MRHYCAAVALIEDMGSRGVGLNVYIWGILMNCLCRLRRVELGFAVLDRVLKLGFEVNSVMLNTPINGQCEGGERDRAAAILKGALGKEDRGLAMELLRKWERHNCKLNVVAYNTVIDVRCKEDMVGRGVEPDVIPYNSLIGGLCYLGRWIEALALSIKMVRKVVRPDLLTYSYLIHGATHQGRWREALVLFERMVREGYVADAVTYSSLVECLCSSVKRVEARRLLIDRVQRRVIPDVRTFSLRFNANAVTFNILIGALFHGGRPEAAEKLFD
ncbi:hypothetical protein EUGRSUZ_H04186 [Eucalyptus grandis]|uniref:Uncharacterized protein n=2 Tax=Eucalyptus grandis TaxID=71139 RepID=A0ACC3JWV1_EUCGR|nr:hypothetical protein EUGRSUZ_H04186 [Eucalyptus grandis]